MNYFFCVCVADLKICFVLYKSCNFFIKLSPSIKFVLMVILFYLKVNEMILGRLGVL